MNCNCLSLWNSVKVFKKARLFAGISRTEDSTSEYRRFVSDILKKPLNHCLICVLDSENVDLKLVACNIMIYRKHGDQLKLNWETPQMRIFTKILAEANANSDLFSEQGVGEFLRGAGLMVDPAFRRCSIATRMLEARRPMLRRRRLLITGNWFTSIGSQKAARSAGYEEVSQINLQDLAKSCDFVFADGPETILFMVLRVEQSPEISSNFPYYRTYLIEDKEKQHGSVFDHQTELMQRAKPI